MISLTIDNQTVESEQGMTILEAARRADIYIPTLCSHPLLEPLGACRLCVVEINDGTRSRMVTSCTYPAENGLDVKTDSDAVIEVRKILVELLLARVPKSIAIQALARQYGIEKTRFKVRDEAELCILCGLCTRVCDDIIKVSAITFVNRGTNREVTFDPEISPELCVGCGVCTAVCPTQCLELEKPYGVIAAIEMGRKAASSIDKFLGGEGIITEELVERESLDLWHGRDGEFADRLRVLDPVSLKEFGDDQAIAEAKRCLECDLRFHIAPTVSPPETWLALEDENIQDLPETEGVFILYDEAKEIFQISGVENIRSAVTDELEKQDAAKYFSFEEDEMFNSRERQLIQQYMKKHGKMPPGNDDEDDLF
ncbi:MAG: 2Fe-2S iron-sulfur cluster-binding protein [Thermodesulfobacteriota bacterium]|nr:2Fe-2S iron-sulfur cluster-binding protein [Thermodesulfobacteriota bacterium]